MSRKHKRRGESHAQSQSKTFNFQMNKVNDTRPNQGSQFQQPRWGERHNNGYGEDPTNHFGSRTSFTSNSPAGQGNGMNANGKHRNQSNPDHFGQRSTHGQTWSNNEYGQPVNTYAFASHGNQNNGMSNQSGKPRNHPNHPNHGHFIQHPRHGQSNPYSHDPMTTNTFDMQSMQRNRMNSNRPKEQKFQNRHQNHFCQEHKRVQFNPQPQWAETYSSNEYDRTPFNANAWNTSGNGWTSPSNRDPFAQHGIYQDQTQDFQGMANAGFPAQEQAQGFGSAPSAAATQFHELVFHAAGNFFFDSEGDVLMVDADAKVPVRVSVPMYQQEMEVCW